ncbi:MAG: CinA family nicotinamide mononucleotide deamidase-related protein [Pseudoflavonifractor sp.]|nr:CinA family nicotinamide mononucleotide deamidase-related protein [Alloprevotella sp.]MCM1116675.1 CinA family nicotinamide mononucleotide deamidase-related protein [Pseudoflavonifractor sp.]
MKISVICIGDELLIGQVTDTNSGMIARVIAPEGWEVERTEIVPDTREAISDAINRALERTDVVITTGGLGPTADDITKPTLCTIFGGGLHHSPEVERNVIEVMARRGRQMNELTRAQALVPDSATVIQNRVGTAPILLFQRGDKTLVAMPGVPFEAQEMFVSDVFPRLRQLYTSDTVTAHQTFIVAGISESQLAESLAPFEASLPEGLHLAYLPRPGIIRLRLDGRGSSRAELSCLMAEQASLLRDAVKPWLIAESDIPTAAILLQMLVERGMTLATAESCTGGNIAHEITLIPGASEAMRGGIVSYSNDAKHMLLGVDSALIDAHGAVSIPVVEAMAQGARLHIGADYAIATSGIAGPGGGSPTKPVGTVCVAVATPSGVISDTLHLTGTRERIINRATSEALIMAIHAVRG